MINYLFIDYSTHLFKELIFLVNNALILLPIDIHILLLNRIYYPPRAIYKSDLL